MPVVGFWLELLKVVETSAFSLPFFFFRFQINQVELTLRSEVVLVCLWYMYLQAWVFALSVSPSGKMLASLNISGQLCLWDLPSLRLRQQWLPDQLVRAWFLVKVWETEG